MGVVVLAVVCVARLLHAYSTTMQVVGEALVTMAKDCGWSV